MQDVIQMQQQDYPDPIQNIDVELDQNQLQNQLLDNILQDSTQNLLIKYQSITNEKDKLQNIKNKLSIVSVDAKECFFRLLWEKLEGIVQEIIAVKRQFKVLKQSSMLQILILAEMKIANLTQHIYSKLHTILQKQTDNNNFMYLLKVLHKVGKHIDKRQQLATQMYNLYKVIKDNQNNNKFLMVQKIYSKTGSDVLEEEKIIFMMFLLHYLSANQNLYLRLAEQDRRKLLQVIKDKPFPNVLDFVIKYWGKSKKLVRDLISCDYKIVQGVSKYVFSKGYLHPSLQTRQTYLKALQCSPQRIFQQLRHQNFILDGDRIYCKISLDVLKKISEQKLEVGQYSTEQIYEMIDLLKFFLANFKTKIISSKPQNLNQMKQQSMQNQEIPQNCDQYLIYTWIIFSKYYYEHERSDLDITALAQKLNPQFINKVLGKCLELLDGKANEAQLFAEEVIKIVIHLLYKNQYAAQANYTSQTSKLTENVLLKMKQLPIKWKNLKKVKALLDKWGETITQITPNLTNLINKFLDSFFDHRLKLKSRNFTHFEMFSNQQYTKAMGSKISQKIRNLLHKSAQKLNTFSIFASSTKQEQLTKINNILYKIACLYLSRMKIPDNQPIADQIFRLYQNWAHQINFCYSFRTWILNYSGKSKDGDALVVVNKMSQVVKGIFQQFKTLIEKLSVQELIKPFKNTKQNQTYGFVCQFINKLSILTNNLQLKQNRDSFPGSLSTNIFSIAHQLHTLLYNLNSKILKQFSTNSLLSKQTQITQISSFTSLYQTISTKYNNLISVIRFYLFNLNRLIDSKDRLSILQSCGNLIKQFQDKNKVIQSNVKFVNDAIGFNLMKKSANLQKGQILANILQRNGMENKQQYFFHRQEYTPMIVVSILYSKLKPSFSIIVKNLLSVLSLQKSSIQKLSFFTNFSKQSKSYTKQQQQQKYKRRLQNQTQTLINAIVLPSINIFGPTYFNNKFQQKGKQQQAFGILFDQFSLFFNDQNQKQKFNSREIACLHNILIQFFQVCKDKQKKVINKQIQNNRPNRRNPFNQGHRQQIINQLSMMGFQPEAVQFALQQTDDQDPEAIMNWLENNHHRMNQLITARTIQRSRVQSQQSKQKMQIQKSTQIPMITYKQFLKQVQQGTKKIIKLLVPQLFSQSGLKIKDLIFVCLDSFSQENYRNKQLQAFSDMMFKQMDKLNSQFSINKLSIAVSSLQIIISKKTDIIKKIHQKLIPFKLLSFIQKSDQSVSQRILSMINSTLPIPSQKQKISTTLKQYLNYISDILLNHTIKSDSVYQILCKMIKAKDQQINQKVLNIVCKNLNKGLLRQKLFSIVNIILDTDRLFSTANIQLQIKSYIMQHHELDNNFNKKLQRFIRFDPKKFSSFFTRYDDHPNFIQVVNKILVKKNNKLSFQHAKHSLYKSQLLNSPWLSYNLPNTQKILIQNLVTEIVKQQNMQQRIQYIKQLHKCLECYKILTPFCTRLQVEGQDMVFGEWLVQKQFSRSRGQVLPFITFLYVRNGLFLDQNYTYADYLSASLITKFIKSEQMQRNVWVKLLILYLLQIKSFNNLSQIPITQQNPITLKLLFDKNLTPNNPTSYLLTCQSLYVILQKQLIDSLLTRYKIETQDQIGVEKQFLNMNLFYTRRKVRAGLGLEEGQDRDRDSNSRLNLQRLLIQLSGDRGQEHDDMEAMQFLRRVLMLRQRNSEIIQPQTNLNSIFVPLPSPQPVSQPNQQSQQQQQQSQFHQNQQKQQTIIKPQQIKQKQQPQQKTPPKPTLLQLIQKFKQMLPQITINMPKTQWKVVHIPQKGLKQQDLKQSLKNKTFNISLKQPKLILDYRFSKISVFKQRIVLIANIVDPNQKFLLTQDPRNSVAQVGLRTQSYGGLRRHMISRALGVQRQARQAPNQVMNLNRLLNQMQQYQQPKQPQKPRQPQKKQQNIMIQQKQQKHQQKQQQVVQESAMKDQKSQQKPVEQKIQNKIQEQHRNIELQQMVPQPQQRQPQIQGSQQENLHIPQQMIQQVQQRIQQMQQIQQEMQEMVQQPPHRQILAMLGLPQTFLQDIGVDISTFDSLPEDMQIQQLTFLIEQQQIANRNTNNQNRPNNASTGQNQGQGQGQGQGQVQGQGQQQPAQQDLQTILMNENAAFIASLDPQLRAQTLMEATPQFLMNLPPAMRAQAENYRQRQISQMLRQQQLQLQQERINRARVPKQRVYPQLTQQNFPTIDKETATKISQSILIKFPKFKLQIFKILLQNKRTQRNAITTLITYIKNIQQLTLTQCSYNKQSKEWQKQYTNFTAQNRKLFIQQILSFIEDNLANCIYKDNKFLNDKQKYGYQNYSGIQMKINQELDGNADGYYPLYELFDIAFDNHSYGLLNKLIKKCVNLPKRLRKRIVRGIRDDKFTDQFYNNLEGLSNNQKLKQTFFKQFPEQKPIKIETLAKVLKYNFSKLPYLKKLHVETLKKYKGSTRPKQIYDFLNQIYSSYTVDDLKQIQPLLLQHKQIHYHIIKYLYESGRSLDTEPIGLILKFPHLLDFETKRFIFQRNPKLHRSRHRCIIEVSRLNLFQQSFNQIMNKSLKQLQGNIKVVFMDEQAQDAGGPKKQWFLSLSKSIFDAHYALFHPSSSGNTYQPNPKSYVNSQHLSYFKFIGRFFAKALCQGMLIDAFFTRSFYKMILGHQLELKDLQQQDYSFYKNMLWLKQNPITQDDDYTFSYTHDYFGKIITKQLIPNGQNIKVNEQNKQDYIHKYIMAIMRDSIGKQIQKFLQGFYQILPKQTISFFEPTQLQLLMSGMPTIDLKDLKLNTDYQGYSPTDPIIKWYWEILEQYTNEDLAHLVQFITGTSKIPLQGFGKLQGMHGPQKITIIKDCHIDQLPKSHTCFNQLDLPNYPTKEILKEKLRITITWGSQGFGFM